MTVRLFWFLLPLVGCNGILGQVPARPTLSIGPCFIWAEQGTQVDVPFTVDRTNVQRLTVHATSLPEGVTATDVVLASDASSGTLTLTASSAATLGATSSAIIQLLEATQVDDEAPLMVGVSGAPGTLDTTWGGTGVVKLPPLVNPTSNYVVDVDSQGRIVVAGTLVISDSDVRIVIARYNTDGALDDTFGDDGASSRLGYTVFNPGWATQSTFSTTPVAVRVDSEDRIVVANTRGAGHCYAELGRWTASGAQDQDFKRFSTFEMNGTQFCGAAADLTIQPDGQIVLLAYWNFHDGMESLVQILDASDGSPTGTYHLVLDPSGTLTDQRMTQMVAVAVDDRGGFVMGGRQYSGTNWAGSGPGFGVIARLGDDGQRDASFGKNAYASWDSSVASMFYDVAIDPISKSIFGVGENEDASLATIARLDGTTGQPAGFGQKTLVTCPGGTGSVLTQVMFDCHDRIVATGPCGKDNVGYIASVRMSTDGVMDASWGTSGMSLVPGNSRGAKLGADGRLYVVGENDFTGAVWRLWP